MRKYISVVTFFIALAVSSFIFSQKETEKISVMTFNIRYNNPQDAPNHWGNRRDFVSDLIHFYNPDFVGAQEVLKDQLVDLQERLPEYEYFGVGRDDGKEAGEFCPVFYKKEKYKLLASATFWLSENPDQAGIKGWDAVCNRVVTWGRFKSKATGEIYFVFNTHFDHKGVVAREESSKLLLRKVQEIAAGEKIMVTGDFNATPESKVYQTLTRGTNNAAGFRDCYAMAANPYGPAWTINGFGNTPVERRRRIDYIFTNKKATVDKYVSIAEQRGAIFPSDHLPVMAEITF